MSLLEITFSLSVLTVALVSVIGMLAQAHQAVVLDRHRTMALDEARGLLNELRIDKGVGLESIEELIKSFPAGRYEIKHADGLDNARLELEYLRGRTDLMQEVTATVSWSDHRGRQMEVALSTLLGAF